MWLTSSLPHLALGCERDKGWREHTQVKECVWVCGGVFWVLSFVWAAADHISCYPSSHYLHSKRICVFVSISWVGVLMCAFPWYSCLCMHIYRGMGQMVELCGASGSSSHARLRWLDSIWCNRGSCWYQRTGGGRVQSNSRVWFGVFCQTLGSLCLQPVRMCIKLNLRKC